jgi:hypothetical protein
MIDWPSALPNRSAIVRATRSTPSGLHRRNDLDGLVGIRALAVRRKDERHSGGTGQRFQKMASAGFRQRCSLIRRPAGSIHGIHPPPLT